MWVLNYISLFLIFYIQTLFVTALNLDYLDPTKLQTKTSSHVQEVAASRIIERYFENAKVTIISHLFTDNKDTFILNSEENKLEIMASSGVAALWGFNYFLKKYCKSQIDWQVDNVHIPNPLPKVQEKVVANDRFRYYQNPVAASYSYVWWDTDQWKRHVEWMALNGINLSLAPVAQEAAWLRIYRQVGMTQDEIDGYFTGPVYLPWLRFGQMHGKGGPLLESWHTRQIEIQKKIVDYMLQLGIVPIFPAFNGHVPKAFKRIYPKSRISIAWSGGFEYYYIHPGEVLFNIFGTMFLNEISAISAVSHLYIAHPHISEYSDETNTSKILSTLTKFDRSAVWLIESPMLPTNWMKSQIKSFTSSIPNGRLLILDMQSEQNLIYRKKGEPNEMYFGHPFISNVMHNQGGDFGMFGSFAKINVNVYNARNVSNSTMIGMGITPAKINQNYVVYDFMLESAWRKDPVEDLDEWVTAYAERRHGCNATAKAWKYLLKSVYSLDCDLNKHNVILERPTFEAKPWSWYKIDDLFAALKGFVFIKNNACKTSGFRLDLIDVTRQVLQYRAEQLYYKMVKAKNSTSWVFKNTIQQFLDIMDDIKTILGTTDDSMLKWLTQARNLSEVPDEDIYYGVTSSIGNNYVYRDKQWAELYQSYYIPRWKTFLSAALDAKHRKEDFVEFYVHDILKNTVEKDFKSYVYSYMRDTVTEKKDFNNEEDEIPGEETSLSDLGSIALRMYNKWVSMRGLYALPDYETANRRDDEDEY